MSKSYDCSTRTSRSFARDNGHSSSGSNKRSNGQRAKSLAHSITRGRVLNEQDEGDIAMVNKYKKVVEPIVQQWVSSLRSDIHDRNKSAFAIDTDEATEKNERLPYKEELALRARRREEEKRLVAAWQGSLRNGLDNRVWVNVTDSEKQTAYLQKRVKNLNATIIDWIEFALSEMSAKNQILDSKEQRSWTIEESGWTNDGTGPLYGSLTYQLREATEEAASLPDLLWQVIKILASGAWVTVVLGVLLIVTLLMSYFGIKYLDDCPIRKEIPVYLLVGGSSGLLMVLMLFLKHRRIRKEDEEDADAEEANAMVGDTRDPDTTYTSASMRVAETLLAIFLIGWFAAGNYWVFSIYKPPFHQGDRSPTPNLWCDQRMYVFTLVQICMVHSLIGLLLLLIVAALCCMACLSTDRYD